MFKNSDSRVQSFSKGKYLLASLALLSSPSTSSALKISQQLRNKAESEWGLLMVPMPSFFDFEQPNTHSMFNSFDNDFGFGSFGSIADDMNQMQKQMSSIGDGNSYSTSTSSSFSSHVDADGKLHKKSSKKATKSECKNGVCKVVECANGQCRETKKFLPKDQQLQENSVVPVDNFKKINGIQSHMHNVFKHFDRHMQEMSKHFADAERNMRRQMEELPIENENEEEEQQVQKFSSQTVQKKGKDGKVIKKSYNEGATTSCHFGTCKEIQCQNGACKMRVFKQKNGDEGKPDNLSKEAQDDQEQEQENVPHIIPPPSFAPKNLQLHKSKKSNKNEKQVNKQ